MAKHRTGYLFKRGNTFYVSWKIAGKAFAKALRDDNGNPITTRREADEARQKVMAPFVVADEAAALESIAGKLEGRKAELVKLQDEQNPPLPISQAWTIFLASPNRPDSGAETMYQYECQFSAFVEWMKEKHADTTALRDVTKEIAEDYAGSLNGGRLSPNTYNKHLNLLTLVFRVLKHKARLTSNHWEEIQRKRIAAQSRRELTIDELKKVCQAATGELRTLFALGIYSGLRLGDCASLRWGEVELARGMIRRIPNKTARRNPKPVIVPIHPVLCEALSGTPANERGEYVLPEIAALYNRRTDLVTDMVQRHFKSCGFKLHKPGTGKDGKRAVVDVGFHSLRHTFVSLCRESNAPLAVVESIVGHSNPAMTRHYTHVGELAAGRAVAALPSVIGEPTQPRNGEQNILHELQRIAESMTGTNWDEKKAAILAMLSDQATKGASLNA
jgi:integrase